MGSPLLQDVQSAFYFAANKPITEMTQNNFGLIAEHAAVMKHIINKWHDLKKK